MSYATIDDVFSRYPPIGNLVGAGSNQISSVDVSSVYIQDSEAVVNAYLASRYVLPLAPEPIIVKITSDIAICNMARDYWPRFPDHLQRRCDNAESMLEMLRDGKMRLDPNSNTIVTTGDQDAFSTTTSYHSIFSPVLDPLDQRVDRDWVEDERDERISDGNNC